MAHKRSNTDQFKLEQIEENSFRRQSLKLDNDYDTSSSELPTLSTVASSKEPTTRPPYSSSSFSLETSSEGQFQVQTEKSTVKVKQSTGSSVTEDITTLKKTYKVDNRRFSHEGLPKSKLSDVKFTKVQSILDRSANWSNESQFAGIYVLFWLGVAFHMLNTFINYVLEKGWQFELVNILLTDLIPVGLTDLWMYLSTYFVLGLHHMIKLGYIDWESTGWIISSVYEFGFLVNFMLYSEHMNFPWIGKIFLYLHSLVLLMKMHSYSFYNGYLWKIKKELETSKSILKKNPGNLAADPAAAKIVEESIAFCEFELKAQSTKNPFPSNISVNNFFWYTMFPTVVYEIDYPRTDKIRWGYVLEKLSAIFGVIALMILIAQNSMYPIAMKAIALRGLPLSERAINYPLLLLNLIPSFLLMYLLVFYLIWDAILNCIAELSRFGDRDFYGPWWNCISWDQFSRIWNIPVHKFLLRHVYHSSISAFHFSKGSATLITFLLSSVVHEGAMFVIFHKFRCYLFLLQMFQLPLVSISKSKFLRDKKVLGNTVFWIGIAFGPSLMCTLYLTF